MKASEQTAGGKRLTLGLRCKVAVTGPPLRGPLLDLPQGRVQVGDALGLRVQPEPDLVLNQVQAGREEVVAALLGLIGLVHVAVVDHKGLVLEESDALLEVGDAGGLSGGEGTLKVLSDWPQCRH